MLDAWAVVSLEVLLDLALSAAGCGFVDRELEIAAVPHDRRSQRGVLRRDLVGVEVLQFGKPEDLRIPSRPLVQTPHLYVRDDVVDRFEANRVTCANLRHSVGDEAGANPPP